MYVDRKAVLVTDVDIVPFRKKSRRSRIKLGRAKRDRRRFYVYTNGKERARR